MIRVEATKMLHSQGLRVRMVLVPSRPTLRWWLAVLCLGYRPRLARGRRG